MPRKNESRFVAVYSFRVPFDEHDMYATLGTRLFVSVRTQGEHARDVRRTEADVATRGTEARLGWPRSQVGESYLA